MGNLLDSKREFDLLEGILGSVLIAICILVALLAVVVVALCQNHGGTEHNQIHVVPRALHTILQLFFSSFTQRKDENDRKILLIWNREASSLILTYVYYYSTMILACLWFITIAMDYSLFLKTTTCDDINPNGRTHICFLVDDGFAAANCNQDPRPGRVICYMFSPNFAGFGIAYGAAKLFTVLADVHYNTMKKITIWCFFISGVFRALVALIALVGFITWWVHFGEHSAYEDYFSYGHIPMRTTQSVLILLTTWAATILPPWRFGHSNITTYSYYDVAHQVEENERRFTCTCECTFCDDFQRPIDVRPRNSSRELHNV